MSQPSKPANVTHHNVRPEIAYAGKKLVVRDKDWSKAWGANLEWAEAHKLKNKVAGSGKSRTVMYEEMPTDPALLAICALAEVQGTGSTPAADAVDDAAIDMLELDEANTLINCTATGSLAGTPVPVPTAPPKVVQVTKAVTIPVAPKPVAPKPEMTDAERAELITRPPPPVAPEHQPVQAKMTDAERAALITGQRPAPVPEVFYPAAAQSDIDAVVSEVFAGVSSQVEVNDRLMLFVSTCGEYDIRALPGTIMFLGEGKVALFDWTFHIVPQVAIDAEGSALDGAVMEDIVG